MHLRLPRVLWMGVLAVWTAVGAQAAALAATPPEAAQAPAAGATPAPAPLAATPAPLPRAAGGITLGMSRADAQQQLGALACHENKAGFEVCDPTRAETGGVHHLELYLFHDEVISLSYEDQSGATAAEILEQTIRRYGRPSLTGLRERDRSGHLHETYGWKDDVSLYSVRFIWQDAENGVRGLVGTVIAIWDRKAYQRWEAEARPRHEPAGEEAPAASPI